MARTTQSDPKLNRNNAFDILRMDPLPGMGICDLWVDLCGPAWEHPMFQDYGTLIQPCLPILALLHLFHRQKQH